MGADQGHGHQRAGGHKAQPGHRAHRAAPARDNGHKGQRQQRRAQAAQLRAAAGRQLARAGQLFVVAVHGKGQGRHACKGQGQCGQGRVQRAHACTSEGPATAACPLAVLALAAAPAPRRASQRQARAAASPVARQNSSTPALSQSPSSMWADNGSPTVIQLSSGSSRHSMASRPICWRQAVAGAQASACTSARPHSPKNTASSQSSRCARPTGTRRLAHR
ncbi:conserved hypothetical protein [Ricinus communis]|uniref:Uncharacterized protein n=1 Tax=Ricinus communis TaxID=3988 RepID=B9TH99_RICCO|nr:conserved hypothetical protein [Ricinus communis]